MRREVEARERDWERRFAQARELQIGAELRLARFDMGVNERVRFVLVRPGDERLMVAFPDTVVAPQTYDLLVYGPGGSITLRQRLDHMLETKIQQVQFGLKLSAANESKLQLAGQGDIKRLFDKLEAGRAEFEVARKDRKQLPAFVEKLDSLRRAGSLSPFEEGSLYSKTLRKILSNR